MVLPYQLLIVDDEQNIRETLGILLRREGFNVTLAGNGAEALDILQERDFDLIVTDMRMPHLSGIELLRKLREQGNDVAVIVVTAFSSMEQAIEAMKLGAYDYITKPFKNDEIRLVVKNALERKHLKDENRQLKQQLGQRFSFKNLIGNSPAMQRVVSLLERVAPSQANVLITGESGTGKEVVAQAIHHNSSRKDHPFVPINCGAIPENLLESELFGHEKGAFTGADRRKEGLFESAHEGTLFLDEIGELPMGMQVKLLRVLQEREFRRVGGTENVPLDIRLIAATNQDLEKMLQQGTFREDLYYRLNVVPLELPALRERTSDIPLLINFFFNQRTGQDRLPIASDALKFILEYEWPGNIRELENFVERCIVLGWEGQVGVAELPAQIRRTGNKPNCSGPNFSEEGMDLDFYLAEIEKKAILRALELSGGNRTKAAELLRVSFRSFRYRLKKIGIDDGDR
jgi:two-component system response regulator PilR (NtrC family)